MSKKRRGEVSDKRIERILTSGKLPGLPGIGLSPVGIGLPGLDAGVGRGLGRQKPVRGVRRKGSGERIRPSPRA
jgi:hypothetical protein